MTGNALPCPQFERVQVSCPSLELCLPSTEASPHRGFLRAWSVPAVLARPELSLPHSGFCVLFSRGSVPFPQPGLSLSISPLSPDFFTLSLPSAGVFSLAVSVSVSVSLPPLSRGFISISFPSTFPEVLPSSGVLCLPSARALFLLRGFLSLPEVLPIPSAEAQCHQPRFSFPSEVPLPSLRFSLSPQLGLIAISRGSLSPQGFLSPSPVPPPLNRFSLPRPPGGAATLTGCPPIPSGACPRAPPAGLWTRTRGPAPSPPPGRGRLSRERRDFSPTCRAVLLMAALERGR